MYLETGKTYENRKGERRTIMDLIAGFEDQFIDSQWYSYHSDGRYWYNGQISDLDLTKEVKMTEKLEVGKMYTARNGKAVFITDINRQHAFYNAYNTINSYDNFLGIAFDKSANGGVGGCYSRKVELVTYGKDGTVCSILHGGYTIDFEKTKTITIDGKDIEISEESFNELKKSLAK